MTSLLKSNSDKPMPAFRSQTNRFPGPHPKFTTADPLHLEPGSNRPRDVQHFVQATPVAFRRGSSSNMGPEGLLEGGAIIAAHTNRKYTRELISNS